MKAQNSQKKPFRIIKLTPYLISIWGDNGYLSVRTLIRNLCNTNFCINFLKRNAEMLSTMSADKMSDEEVIDNLLFLYTIKLDGIKEDFESIKLFFASNLIRFEDEEFRKKYSREFFKRFSHIDDIWLEV